MPDQKTDNENRGGSPNMTISTTSKSPKHGTSIRAVEWLDKSDGSADDNNGFHGRVKSVKRNKG